MKTFGWEKSKHILRRILSGLLTLLAVGATIGVIAGIVYFIRLRSKLSVDITASKHLPQELAAAKAAGWPLSAADLQLPLPPPSQNAAPVYVQLGQTLKRHRLTSNQIILEQFKSSYHSTSAEWIHSAEAIHERPDLYALIHRAAARPQCVFARDWKTRDPENIMFPEYETVREAMRLLTAQSLVMAHQGHTEAAIQNEALGFTIARHGASDRIAISYLVGIACDAITLDGLKQIVFLSHGSPPVAAAVQSVIVKNWKMRSLAPTLQGEIAMAQGKVDYWRKTGPTDMGDFDGAVSAMMAAPVSLDPQKNWATMLDINDEYMLRQMSPLIPMSDQPYRISSPFFVKTEDEIEKQQDSAHSLSAILCPITPALVQKRTLIQALVNVDCAGYAVMVMQGNTGKLPEHFPGTFADPFTDKSLGYRREGKAGFVVYSAGPNGDFNGSKPGVKPKSFQTYFRYPEIPEK